MKVSYKAVFVFFFVMCVMQINAQLPKGFSYVNTISPTIQSELRYCNHNNFVGVPVKGYEEEVLITSTKTALALKKVQDELYKKKLGLKIFDAYRPQRAVNHFIKWAKTPHDTLTKRDFYPKLNKKNLFKLGFISSRSGHSRGSSVDLTIINLKTGKELDMGSPYDFFGEISATFTSKINKAQLNNRLILKKVMEKYGFKPYSRKEWWHFTLKNEPFPKTYFDFPIQ